MTGRQPNILFIQTDQLAANVLNAYGGTVCKTPHLDRLAVEGVVFENYNLEDVEKTVIRQALKKNEGNVSHAAKELGLTRTSLYRRMEKYGL